jgi:archaellum component FlaD/FlaE
MVLGLIEFLLGGKKKAKVPKTGQVSSPAANTAGPGVAVQQQTQQVPNGQDSPTQNVAVEQDNSGASPQQAQNQQAASVNTAQSNGSKKSVSEAIHKIYGELKSTNERMSELVGDIKNIENTVNTLGHRVDELEESKKESDEKFSEMDHNMSKFLSLYELINNQYNPFVEQVEKPNASNVKTVVLDSNGNSVGQDSEVKSADNSGPKSFEDLDLKKAKEELKNDDVDSLLQLDTLNIEEAAADAVPLTRLKNNTNSLVIILSWLEYMINRVGIEETRNSLRYYTEVLRWITPEVYFDLDKYLRGMKDKKELEDGSTLSVKDHIVSLYFISKLNEKNLDEKLTRAVLQIIKE